MSAIEKVCRLSLAIDRISRHGEMFLNEKIATAKMILALESVKEAVEEIPDWEEFIEREANWWVDLTEEKANDI